MNEVAGSNYHIAEQDGKLIVAYWAVRTGLFADAQYHKTLDPQPTRIQRPIEITEEE